jgi:hypothetical protein
MAKHKVEVWEKRIYEFEVEAFSNEEASYAAAELMDHLDRHELDAAEKSREITALIPSRIPASDSS